MSGFVLLKGRLVRASSYGTVNERCFKRQLSTHTWFMAYRLEMSFQKDKTSRVLLSNPEIIRV